MGEVYRARDSKLNRDVAIKILPAALAHDAQYMARFEREAQTLASLNHPNIATVYGMPMIGLPTATPLFAAGEAAFLAPIGGRFGAPAHAREFLRQDQFSLRTRWKICGLRVR
jgi:hypothetical protein